MAPYMVRGGHYMAEGDHPWRRRWSGRTIHGAVYGPGGTLYGGRGPSMALRMVRPDHVRRRGWSGRTIYAAMDGPAGPSTAPWMVPRTMYGAVDGPAGPTVGGTIYGMTLPLPEKLWERRSHSRTPLYIRIYMSGHFLQTTKL